MQQSSPLRVAFFWRSLGPHHAARMAALAERPELAAAGPLRVVERFPGGDPERAWRADRGALRGKLDLLGWEEALRREDWGEFDAAVFPGWAERDFLRFARRRLPERCLRVVWSVSCAHDRPRRPWREWLKRRRVARFDAALAAGKLAAAYLRDLGMPAERVAEVGNAADPAPFAAAREAVRAGAPRPEWMDAAGLPQRYILQAGRLAPEKNPARTLAAFLRLLGETEFDDSGVGLVFAGEGPERAALEALIPPGRRGRIVLLGETPPERLAPLMARCEFLVLPSAPEPWGLVANEAMAAGRPVLMSPACGCLPELGAPGAAWIAGGEGVESLERGLARALRSPGRDAMGALAARFAESQSPERFAERTAAALVRFRELGRVKGLGRFQDRGADNAFSQ